MGYLAFAAATVFLLVCDVFLGDRETGLWLALDNDLDLESIWVMMSLF